MALEEQNSNARARSFHICRFSLPANMTITHLLCCWLFRDTSRLIFAIMWTPKHDAYVWLLNISFQTLICCHNSLHSSGKATRFWSLAAGVCSHSAKWASVEVRYWCWVIKPGSQSVSVQSNGVPQGCGQGSVQASQVFPYQTGKTMFLWTCKSDLWTNKAEVPVVLLQKRTNHQQKQINK